MRLRHSGFTLVELSIVLVILGLLVGGVLAGQSLIRAAELRSAITEYESYTTAINSFREKYMALPGDMPNAVRFWGAAAGSTADGVDNTCADISDGADPANMGRVPTCNGNGNGQISEPTWLAPNDRIQFYEAYRAWQHLANAGLIEGSFTGAGAGRNFHYDVIGVNVPKSRIGGALWTLTNMPAGYGSSDWFLSEWGNILKLGKGSDGETAVLTPPDAWNLDSKFDDGKPGYGRVLPFKPPKNPGCVTSTAQDADYDLSVTTVACTLNVRLGYGG